MNRYFIEWASLVAQSVTKPPARQETQVWLLSWEDPVEEEMATHCSILAWRIPWTEEPGGLQFPGSQRVWQEWSNLAHTRPRAGNEQYKLEILLIPKDRSTTGAPSKRVRGQLKEAPSGPKRDNFSNSKNTVDWSPSDMSKSLKPTHWSLSQDADTNTLFLKTGQ